MESGQLLEIPSLEDFSLSASSLLGEWFWLTLALIFFFFRIISLIWVIKDASSRSDSGTFLFFSMLMIICLTPIFWLPLYIACRPQGFKWDKRPWRDLSLASLQECSNCHELNLLNHKCCVFCWDSLQLQCRECWENYAFSYDYCPCCWAPNIEH